MMDQISAVSRPSVLSRMSPLEHVLASRSMSSGMPSMNLRKPSLKMPKIGMHENQPKIKPLASHFHKSLI